MIKKEKVYKWLFLLTIKMIHDINIKDIILIAKEAGKIILEEKKDLKVEIKEDETGRKSEVTNVDHAAESYITSKLREFYSLIHLIAEEEYDAAYRKDLGNKDWEFSPRSRKYWREIFFVDAYDGTKDISHGDGSVNIGYVFEDFVKLGVVHLPFKNITYWGAEGLGSFKQIGDEKPEKLEEKAHDPSVLRIAISRSHSDIATDFFIRDMRKYHPKVEVIQIGSSEKLCLVADGTADLYPRFGPTREWDIAAAHAVVKFAGKNVYPLETLVITGEELTYNKPSIINPPFLVK
jgi:3'(2'), 5'-bisphosphate nucleotidase